MWKKLNLTSEFYRFVLAGTLAAGVNFFSRIIYSEYMTFRVAIIIAYITGMVAAFILSKLYVFQASRYHAWREFLYFSVINLLAVAQVWIFSVGLAEYFFPFVGMRFYTEEIAHLIGLAIPVVTSYLGHKHFSFRRAY